MHRSINGIPTSASPQIFEAFGVVFEFCSHDVSRFPRSKVCLFPGDRNRVPSLVKFSFYKGRTWESGFSNLELEYPKIWEIRDLSDDEPIQ